MMDVFKLLLVNFVGGMNWQQQNFIEFRGPGAVDKLQNFRFFHPPNSLDVDPWGTKSVIVSPNPDKDLVRFIILSPPMTAAREVDMILTIGDRRGDLYFRALIAE